MNAKNNILLLKLFVNFKFKQKQHILFKLKYLLTKLKDINIKVLVMK